MEGISWIGKKQKKEIESLYYPT
jgi:hypothetical protein